MNPLIQTYSPIYLIFPEKGLGSIPSILELPNPVRETKMPERQTKAGNQEFKSLNVYVNLMNKFCFHVYAQKSLIISEIGNVYF